MKTSTYLRFTLLLPFLVWGICALLFLVGSRFDPLSSGNGPELKSILFVTLAFYVFGIIGWFLPYLLLSLILLVWSFKDRAERLVKGFALSPLAMTVFVLIFVGILLPRNDLGAVSPELTVNPGELIGSTLFFAVITLFWGYLNVGIGYGIYKLLQRRQLIRDDVMVITPETPQEA